MTNKSDIDHIYQVSSPPKTAEMSWFADRVDAAELEEAEPWKATLRAPEFCSGTEVTFALQITPNASTATSLSIILNWCLSCSCSLLPTNALAYVKTELYNTY